MLMTMSSYRSTQRGTRMDCECNGIGPITWSITCRPVPDESLMMSKAVVALHATAKLLIGPTIEVSTSSSTGLRKFLGLTGVGLAQPKRVCAGENRPINGNKTDP